jgi:hypothetical protein
MQDILEHPRLCKADNAAEVWFAASHTRGRTAIYNALKVDPNDRASAYALAPFRIVRYDEKDWIAGAIGSPPVLDPVAIIQWTPHDITDVLLWNPRLNTAQIMGEATSQACHTAPNPYDNAVKVFADLFAFFRAWGARRADRFHIIADPTWVHPRTEAHLSDMPGIFVQGSLAKINWRAVDVPSYIAGPGCDVKQLQKAVALCYPVPKVSA